MEAESSPQQRSPEQASPTNRRTLTVCSLLVLLVAYATFVRDFYSPQALFWDENYHISAAYKYLNGVFFMEPHPPLGKLLIAAGEYLLQPNPLAQPAFLNTDHVEDLPPHFLFVGVRLFPTLLGACAALLLFHLLHVLTKSVAIALPFTLLYLLDNALIVHLRAAMLEGPHLFFVLATLLYAAVLWERHAAPRWWQYLLLGTLASLAFHVKITGAIILPLIAVLAGRELWQARGRRLLSATAVTGGKLLMSAVGFASVGLVVWQIHFSLASRVIDDRWYRASDEYKRIVEAEATGNLANFPVMLRDSYRFFRHYQRGVPELDLCRDGENGSYPIGWPIGHAGINYRWERTGDGAVRYLYLVPNPVGWGVGLIGILSALILIGARLLFGLSIRDRRLFSWIAILATLYLAFMAVMVRAERVMYLYHYFIPLIFSYCIAALMFCYGFGERYTQRRAWVVAALLLIVLQLVAAFWFFAPLTYYEPLTAREFLQRAWFEHWRLEPVL